VDGDFIISQLIPELQNTKAVTLILKVFPFGGVQVLDIPNSVTNENEYYCTGENATCEANLIDVSMEDSENCNLTLNYSAVLCPTKSKEHSGGLSQMFVRK